MSSTGSSESDLCTSDEWTVVTHLEGGGIEKQAVVSVRRDSKPHEESNKKEEEVQEAESNSNNSVSSDWEPVKGNKPEEDALSSGSSDIAVLGDGDADDEDDVTKKQHEKTPQPEDALGLSRVEELRDDMSDISSVRDEINSEVDFSPSSFRHYVHVPNNRVNLTLTVVAVLAITAVLGLGVGNFIGWSCMHRVVMPSMPIHQQHKRHEKYHGHHPQSEDRVRPKDHDILKQLRFLHRQLTMCNKQPNNKECLKNGEQWHRQFAYLIASEAGSKFLNELQSDSSDQFPSETLSSEGMQSNSQQRQLRDLEDKLSALSKQIEGLQAQKNHDETKDKNPSMKPEFSKQAEESRQNTQKVDDSLYAALNEQVQLLKNQNHELHSMLQSLQNKDDAKTQDKPELLKLREEVARAVQENNKLRAMVDNIKTNRETDVRQQINDLQMENQDLRVEIGRLRYSQSKQQELKPEPELVNDEAKESKEAQETNNGLFSKWPEVNWTELVNHLGSTGQGKRLEELGEALSQLLRDLWELNATLFPPNNEEMTQQEEEREDSLKEIENLLVSKWRELQGIVSLSKGYVSRHTEGMSRLLATSMSKVYKTGVKVLFGDPHKESPTVASIQPQLQKIMSKMGKVMTSLEEKWNKMKKRLSSEQINIERSDGMGNEMDLELEDADDETDSATQWMFQRAKDRDQNRETSDSKFYEDWYLLRSKNRKRQRQEQEKHVPCKDPKKCKKAYKKQNPKVEDSSDETWEDLPKHTFKESRGY